ncbi:MAG: FHA domain-containing protein [Gemmatimonadales bacterium]
MVPLILEVTDARGRLRERIRLGSDPVTLGRGYSGTVVIDDPYVDPLHLELAATEDGSIEFRDPGSVNGTWDMRSGRRVSRGPVVPGLELRIGRSFLRVISADQPVPPAIPDVAGRASPRRLLAPGRSVGILALTACLAVLAQFFVSTDPTGLIDLITPALAALMMAAIWAAGWAFTTRVVTHRFRFLAHLAWTVLVAALFSIAGITFDWIGFFVPSDVVGYLEAAVWFGLGTWLLVGHLELVSDRPARHRWSVAALITAVVVAVWTVLSQAEGIDDSGWSSRDGILKPVSARFIPTQNIDRFFERTERLKISVDGLSGRSDAATDPE